MTWYSGDTCEALTLCGSCMSLCYLLGPGLPLHLTGHMGLRRDAAKMPAVENNKLFSYLIFFF